MHVPQALVDAAGDSRGSRADAGLSAGEQPSDGEQLAVDLAERTEPAEVRAAIATCAGLAHDRIVRERENPAGRAEFDRAAHAGLDIRDLALDLEAALDPRGE